MKKISPTSPLALSPFAARAVRRPSLGASLAWLFASVAGVASVACSSAASSSDERSDADAGSQVANGADGSANGDAGGGEIVKGGKSDAGVVAPPSCDLAKDPKDSPACVADAVGVFVDGTAGLDTNDGSRAHPVAHIQAALPLLGARSRVYVCAGTYAEHVTISSGAGIYGGFACGTYAYDASNVVSIAPTDAGYALEIANAANAVTVEDVSLTAVDGTASAPSSIAVFAHGSAPVTMKRVAITAGNGYAGTSSTVGSNYDLAQAPQGNPGGSAGEVPVAGLPPTCTCANASNSAPGKGFGAPFTPTKASVAGGPAIAGTPGGAAGAGTCSAGGIGSAGANGAPGGDAAAPTVVGNVTAQGWMPRGGGGGSYGGTAQGGGGGDGFSSNTLGSYGGGSGACGGCGGAPAIATTGGGGSIAVLSYETAIAFVGSSLVTGNGGDGGAGSPGQAGQLGGVGGAGATNGGCSGGNGGNGGNGGASAGGAGGVSFGVLYLAKTVSAPSLDSATLAATTLGSPGMRGAGGASGLDGVAVAAQKVQDASSL